MILFPPAKINLGLHVLRKREDGYHDLDTCMVPIPLYDVLEILPSEQFEYHQTGLVIPGSADDNLCVKAYNLLKAHYNLPQVYMHLRKEIPMGAGLGGGSADAAYVLTGLNTLFELNLSSSKLEAFAAQLGSDCPFFVKNEAQIARGRGEILSPCALDLKGMYLKIINPGIHVGTKEAYAGVLPNAEGPSVSSLIEAPIESWKNQLKNDFEVSVFSSHSILKEIKEKLYAEGAIYAAMSGSGSTMFGIFKEKTTLSFQTNSAWMERVLEFE
jgi:4-diphosphocytidyl-2-C-methyl-D-erythritol kinase